MHFIPMTPIYYERKTTKDLMVPIKEAKSLHGSMAES